MTGYKIIQIIYKSDRITVSRAIRETDGKMFVLKSLNSELPGLKDITRIKYEYELSKIAAGTGIVPIHSLERYGNVFTLVMDDVNGIPLMEYWNSTNHSFSQFLNLSIQITEIIRNLHKKGIIHKDIKPANILVDKSTEKVYIIDLGFSSLLGSEEQSPVQPETLEGTLSYISPEQTGRMNRRIDFRSDLYSLGVTLYQLFTQKLPFEFTDPVELVHAHIATSPVPPHELNSEFPLSVSNLILKLLSKNAEDRYFSANGVLEDLIVSGEQLNRNLPIDFIPGERESKGIFSIPQKLYGREAEVSFLLDAFDRIASSPERIPEFGDTEEYGGTKLVLVGGYSGVGKTALINEIHKPILEKRGYFLSGKFDQFKRNIPYFSIIQAFTGLVRQILTEREESINKWKIKIMDACSPNLILLTDLIPELIHIVGTQQHLEELSGSEAEKRFQNTFLNFIKVFASIEHPLTIFLDDLQWADTPTLKFIELLVSKKSLNHLLILGAYRDNEVDSIHPLVLMTSNLEKNNFRILKIFLAPLMEFFIEQMICDTLQQNISHELPSLIHVKTGGNPFFVRQFLTQLYRDKLLYYNENNIWEFNIDKIKEKDYSDNVVDIIAGRIRNLNTTSLEILKIASCIGTNFTFKRLIHLLNKKPFEIIDDLRLTIREIILKPVSSTYKVAEVMGESDTFEFDNFAENIEFKFIHDRIQQACSTLLSQDEKTNIHIKIGTSMLGELSDNNLNESIFEVVNHLNFGIGDFDRAFGNKVIKLNYHAGERALESFAYEPAMAYFSLGSEYHDLYKNEEDSDILFNLKYKYYLSKYKMGNMDNSESEFLSLLDLSNNIENKALVYSQLVEIQTNLGKMSEVVHNCFLAMKLFNIEMKEFPNKRDIFIYFKRVQKKISDRGSDDLRKLPELKNRNLKIAMEILMNSAGAAYWQNPDFGILCSLIMVEISLEHGNSYASSFGYSIFGIVLLNFGDFVTSYNFGRLALELNEKYHNPATLVKVPLVFSFSINNWRAHSKIGAELMMETFRKYSHLNDKVFLGSIIPNTVIIYFILGENYPDTLKTFKPLITYLRKSNLRDHYYWTYLFITLCEVLMGKPYRYYNFEGLEISEEEYKSELDTIQSKVGLHLYYIFKMNFYYLEGDFENALQSGKSAIGYRAYGLGMLHSSHEIFIYTLSILKCITLSENSLNSDLLTEAENNLKQFKVWSENNSSNFEHRYLLLLAEFYKIQKDYWNAYITYEKALDLSIKNHYTMDSGLISELCGEFFLESFGENKAGKYFKDAFYYYNLCGAKLKADSIIKKYSKKFSVNSDIKDTNQTTDSLTINLDFSSISKATTTISAEVHYESLIKKTMMIILENAGAQRNVLILYHENKLHIEAEGNKETNSISIYQNQQSSNYESIPMSVINYVTRTQEPIILDSAYSDEFFGKNNYINSNQIVSLLCMPIISKGKPIGLLYLENNLSKGAFNMARVQILNVILSQLSISIENSKLYNSLEEKVKARTNELSILNQDLESQKRELEFILSELRNTQAQLVEAEKSAALGQLISGVAHEINNPLAAIRSGAEILEMDVQRVIGEVPEFFRNLDLESLSFFRKLQSLSLENKKIRSTREERLKKKKIMSEFENYEFSSPEIMEKMVETLCELNLESYYPELKERFGEDGSTTFLNYISLFHTFIHTLGNIKVSTEKSSRVIFSLRKYLGTEIRGSKQRRNISDLLESSLRVYNSYIQSGLTLEKEFGDHSSVECIVDEVQQVFKNIIFNAIQSMYSTGEKVLRISTFSGRNDEPYSTIIIEDTGHGINRDIQNKIFTPFFTTKPRGEGIGLGLYISRLILMEHGGDISFEGKERGTRFIIRLPYIN